MTDSDLTLTGISGVTWEDDDGTTYRRVHDPENGIQDIPVGDTDD